MGATVLGAVAGAVVAFGFLDRPVNSGAAPPPAYVPVIGPTNAPAATASDSAMSTPSATATSASPRPSASASATRKSPSPSPAPSRLAPRTYAGDASANILDGGARVGDCSACPDGTKIRFIGNGGTLTFPNVGASVAGSYTLTIAYTEGDTSGGRDAIVSVDGTDADEYFNGNGDWNSVQTLTMTVHLAAGDNSIEFSNPRAQAPDIVEITV